MRPSPCYPSATELCLLRRAGKRTWRHVIVSSVREGSSAFAPKFVKQAGSHKLGPCMAVPNGALADIYIYITSLSNHPLTEHESTPTLTSPGHWTRHVVEVDQLLLRLGEDLFLNGLATARSCKQWETMKWSFFRACAPGACMQGYSISKPPETWETPCLLDQVFSPLAPAHSQHCQNQKIVGTSAAR